MIYWLQGLQLSQWEGQSWTQNWAGQEKPVGWRRWLHCCCTDDGVMRGGGRQTVRQWEPLPGMLWSRHDGAGAEPVVASSGGGVVCGETLPAGVLIRGGCTLTGERREERRGEHQGLEIMVLSLPVVASRPQHSAPTTTVLSTISGKTFCVKWWLLASYHVNGLCYSDRIFETFNQYIEAQHSYILSS